MFTGLLTPFCPSFCRARLYPTVGMTSRQNHALMVPVKTSLDTKSTQAKVFRACLENRSGQGLRARQGGWQGARRAHIREKSVLVFGPFANLRGKPLIRHRLFGLWVQFAAFPGQGGPVHAVDFFRHGFLHRLTAA